MRVEGQIKDDFLQQYEELYYKDKDKDAKGILGYSGLKTTWKKVEKFINEELNALSKTNYHDRELKNEYMLWKAGRLKSIKDENGKEDIIKVTTVVNGHGKEIKDFACYRERINSNQDLKDFIMKGDITAAYSKLFELQQDTVKNLGSVYMITIIYFLSAGKYPIYDKYAHKAVKALYFDINPKDIYVGDAPDKTKVGAVMAMYQEYLWLLEQVFSSETGSLDGTFERYKERYKRTDKPIIDRSVDRALWVYGHSNIKFPE